MQKVKKIVPFAVALMPMLAFAKTAGQVIEIIKGILNTIVPLLIAVAVVIFLVGVVKYITAGADEEKRTEARNTMIFGIVGLFVMVALWGLVNILVSTLGLEGPSNIPTGTGV